MWTQPQRVLRLRLVLLDTDRPVERVVEIDSASRLDALHTLIQSTFTWSGRSRHIFTDRRSATGPNSWGEASMSQQRVWEMEHLCRNRGHVSECEWTATVGAVLDSCATAPRAGELFYEYAVESACPAYERGSGCLLAELDRCEARGAHGWTVSVEPISERKPRRHEPLPALIGGCGRAPFEETGGAAGDAALNSVLDNPAHPRYAEFDAWARVLAGPLAASAIRAFDADHFDPKVAALAFHAGGTLLDFALPERLVAAASAIPRRNRLDVLDAAAAIGLEHPAVVDVEMARRVTHEISECLRSIAGAAHHADSAPGDEQSTLAWVRSLGLVLRRKGELQLTRVGERLMDDPEGLLSHCADRYWRAAGESALALHVLLAVAHGLAGDELITQVMASRSAESASADWSDEWSYSYRFAGPLSNEDAALRSIERCTAFLARLGAFSAAPGSHAVTTDGVTLATAILSR